MHCYVTEADIDYGAGPYNITFLAGRTKVVFNVTIVDDNVVETDENFTLTIDPSSLPSKILVGSPSQTRVTILDDDSKFYAVHVC